MKPLRNMLDRLHPLFDKGGRLEVLYPIYEMIDTFLYTPGETTSGASHVRDGMDLKRMMGTVGLALIPCILMAMYNTGYQANLALDQSGMEVEGWRATVMSSMGVSYDPNGLLSNLIHGSLYFLPALIVTMVVGGLWETIFSIIRRHEINEGFLVTGLLFPLTLPPNIPLWQVALGISFGVVVGKEIFGGTGRNFLNPALTARAFLYFAYPAQITGTIWTAGVVDGSSAATPLGAMADASVKSLDATNLASTLNVDSWMQAFIGFTQGSMGETSTLACIIGAAILIVSGVGSWRIMAGVVAGSMALSTLFYGIAGENSNAMFHLPPWWHLVVGGLAFGLVFMATDPVSAAITNKGKWVYGILIGVMTILIRVVNPAYPEGIMLAILFANVFAPVIDHFVVASNIKRRKARNVA